MRDVAPADAVLRFESRRDELAQAIRPDVERDIRAGEPPLRDTYDRLIRTGYSGEEATDMICTALVIEMIRQARDVPDGESLIRALSRLPNFPYDE
jgi:hypothetical protein